MKENKAFVGAWLSRDTHSALIQFASSQGKDPTELAAQLISDGLTELYSYKIGTLDEPNPRLELNNMYLQSKQRGVMRQQLVALAITIIQTNVSEKFIDAVERLSTENGFDFEEIRGEAQNLTRISSSAIYVTEQDGTVGKAAQMLTKMFANHSSINVSYIEEVARAQNISMNAVRVAKKQIGLVSVRKEKGWAWELQYQMAPSMVENHI